jgi:hypothetical protein
MQQSFGFILDFNNTYCEVILGEDGIATVYFNGRIRCYLEIDENSLDWVQVRADDLRDDLVREIGERIYAKYM